MINDIAQIVLIALALSADCFAVAASSSISIKYPSRTQILRTSFSFGGFQALMLSLGWLAGNKIITVIADYDHWVAFGLLAFVGGRMIWESIKSDDKESRRDDPTRGNTLFLLAIATSLDALGVGLGLALLKADIIIATAIVGTTAFGITALGFKLGTRIGKHIGERAETIGGIVLIIIGIRILLSHLL